MIKTDISHNIILRPQFRGQPRGTYKLLFNALHAATLDALPKYEKPSPEDEPTAGTE